MDRYHLARIRRSIRSKARPWFDRFRSGLTKLTDKSSRTDSRDVHLRYKSLIRVSCHDLSNQLTLIMGSAQIAQTPGFKNQAEKNLLFWQKIENAADQLSQLSCDLRAFEAMQEPKRLVIRRVKLLPLLEELSFSLQERLEQKGLTLKTDHTLEANTQVLIDPHYFSVNCMKKVMANAIFHSPKGALIELRSFEKSGLIHIQVSDHGPGISQEIFKKLFQFDFMKDKPEGSSEKGAGFGLSIARLLLRELGGDLNIETRFNKSVQRTDSSSYPKSGSLPATGTVVTMTLPFKSKISQELDEFEACVFI